MYSINQAKLGPVMSYPSVRELLQVKFVAEESYTSVQGNKNMLNNSESIVNKLKGHIIDVTV